MLSKYPSKFKRYLKWFLLIFCLIFVVVNYYAFIDVLGRGFIKPLNSYLPTIGFFIDVEKICNALLTYFLPGSSLLVFILSIRKKNVRKKLKLIYSEVTFFQLFLASFSLPVLLFYQNKACGYLINLHKDGSNFKNYDKLWKSK